MWSEKPAVKATVWRILKKLSAESWCQDLLDMFYLDEDTQQLIQITEEKSISDDEQHIDSNGVVLQSGDNVTIIKDLNVKGSSFTAKRGTTVRGISLDPNNYSYIEGKVNGQRIVILTQYVKKI